MYSIMSNSEKLQQAFSKALHIDISKVTDALTYNSIPEWDSVAHMILVTELETVFDVMLDTDDILDLSSVEKARQILAKHAVEF